MFAGELQKQKAVFAAADVLALFIAFSAALMLHDPGGAMEVRLLRASPDLLILGAILLAAMWLAVFRACELYRMRNGGLKELEAIVRGSTIAALLTVLAGFLAHLDVSRLTVVVAYALATPSVVAARAVARWSIRRFYTSPENAVPLVLIGFNQVGRYLCESILDQLTPYEIVGFLDDGRPGCQYRGYPVLGPVEKLGEIARLFPGLEAAVAMPDSPREREQEVVALCERHDVRWWLVPWVSNHAPNGLRFDTLGVIPLISVRGSNIGGLNFAIKRAFDLFAASVLLALSAPVLLVGALAIRIFDGRPILFRQIRIGARGRPFAMLKLRTMRASADDAAHRDYVRRWIRNGAAASEAESPLFKLGNDNRITPVGRILRRFSIDELPQLLNVIRGEMSLIGPRPALPYEIELYQPWHRRRLDAIPGITGLWQVSGRNRLSFDEMVRLDVQYLNNWSLGADLRILMRTLPVLLRGEGV
jgi:exopolysaccharide biosynthesis polyprenyl glycosylphosphotransferase